MEQTQIPIVPAPAPPTPAPAPPKRARKDPDDGRRFPLHAKVAVVVEEARP